MKIYIEGSSFYGKRTGVGRYSLNVSQQLSVLRPKDGFVVFSFLRPFRTIVKDFTFGKNVSFSFIRIFPGRVFSILMRNGISLPLNLFGIGRADVLIFPNFISWASLTRKKRICIIHDVAYLYYPEYIQDKNLKYLRKQLPKSLHRSARIATVSEATKQDLVKEFSVDPDKISIVHNAVDQKTFNPQAVTQAPAVRKKYQLPVKYILYVGTVEPRKNIVGLIEAYAQSYDKHGCALVVAGGNGWNLEKIEAAFAKHADLPIFRLDYVADIDLPALYAGAQLFVFPSYYEGFGLPVLEAMAVGCPVVCSNTSSLPEIVGSAAVMVAPDDIDELAMQMQLVIGNQQKRQQLIDAGFKQARNFTWQHSAHQLSDIIDAVS